MNGWNRRVRLSPVPWKETQNRILTRLRMDTLARAGPWLWENRKTINAKIGHGIDQLELGEGIRVVQLEVHLSRLKNQTARFPSAGGQIVENLLAGGVRGIDGNSYLSRPGTTREPLRGNCEFASVTVGQDRRRHDLHASLSKRVEYIAP